MSNPALRILLVSFLAVLAALCRCTTNLAGGGTEDGNATKICGRITDATGAPAPGTQVTLLHGKHNPALTTPVFPTYKTVTDASGSYSFTIYNLNTAAYNVEAVHEESGKRGLVTGVAAGGTDSVFVPGCPLLNTGTVKVFLPDTLDTAGAYLFVEGTTIWKNLSETVKVEGGYVLYLGGLPATILPSIVYGRGNNAFTLTILDGVKVLPGDTTKTQAFYFRRHYTKNDSTLPSDVLCDIYFDRSGNKWFATPEGIARLTGDKWTTYTVDNTGGVLPSDIVYCITSDAAGAVWFGTSRGIAKFDGSQWTKYTPLTTGLQLYDGVSGIVCDNNGALWFGTREEGLARFRNDSWAYFDTSSDSGLISNEINDMVVDKYNKLWCATKKGIAIYDTAWSAWNPFGGETACYRILIDRQKRQWIATFPPSFGMYDSVWHDFENTGVSAVLSEGTVQKIYEDPDGVIWVGTNAGLTKFDGTSWTDCTGEKYDFLENRIIIDIATDSDRSTWLATDSGVIVFGLQATNGSAFPAR